MSPNPSNARSGYQPQIDGLRAIAILAVVGYHAFPAAVPGGFIGVDIFFVISGFLISGILYREFGEPRSRGGRVIMNFYARRVRRIFPGLILILLAGYALGFLLLLPGEFEKLCQDLVGGAGFCLNFLLAGEAGYFNRASAANPLLHLWSLAVEEQFYLVWPLVIWVVARCRIRFLPVAVFLGGLSYFWNAHKSEAAVAAAFYLPQMRLWELLIGAIVAALLQPETGAGTGRPTRAAGLTGGRGANLLALAGLALVGAGMLFITDRMGLPNAWTLLPTLGTACLLAAGESAWVNRRVLSLPPLVWVGLISYPLYLWHWPLLSFSLLDLDHPDSVWLKAGLVLAAVALAWLTTAFIEQPLRHGGRVAGKVAGLLVAMAAVAGLGAYAHYRHGFPSRFPPLIQELAHLSYDPATGQRSGYFLSDGEDETYFQSATDPAARRKPKLYLWGDSHAAALYPGLQEAFGAKYDIVQRTAGNLAPFTAAGGDAQATHARINAFILASIRQDRPAGVILEANWPEWGWAGVVQTIADLKAAGVPRIVLVGPVPQWEVSLPQQLGNYARRHRDQPVPTRLQTGLRPEPLRIDAAMAAWCAGAGIEYVSPCQILENQDGFLVRLGDTGDSLIAFDYGHLTVTGSRYLAAHFPKR